MSPELEHIRREVERVTSKMSPDSWGYAPPGKWSCAQTLEHLRLSYTATTKGTLIAIETGKPSVGRPTLKDKVATFYVAKLGMLPPGRMALEHTVPQNGGIQSLRHFNDALVAMDATLMDAEKRFGSATRILDHPILGPLNAKDWRRVHLAHTRHHLKKISKCVRQAVTDSRKAVG